MKTDAEWNAWLKDPNANRVVLLRCNAKVGVTETPIYMSTGPTFTTKPTDSPASTPFLGIAKAGALFNEELALGPDSRGGLSTGLVEISNPNGVRDAWRNYIWANRRIEGLAGDMTWALDDFRVVFDGIVADIATRPDGGYGLKLRDKSQRFNTPVSDVKIGGTGPNKDALVPVVLGMAHNMLAPLTDPGTLEHAGNVGRMHGDLEARIGGVPVDITVYPLTGRFVLNAGNVQQGDVTVSIKGNAPGGVYENTVSKLVQRLVTDFGKASERLIAADLDTANLAAFETAHAQFVGIPITDRVNVVDVVDQLASSLGAEVIFSRTGKLRLIKLALPATGPTFSVYPRHMTNSNLFPVERKPAVGAVQLGFNRNWTPQPGLQASLPALHKELYGTEWLTATASDSTVLADHKQSTVPVQQDTLLLRRVDADAEALRRLNMWKVPRFVYEFEGNQECLDLYLGQCITVYHDRWEMQAGVNAVVCYLAVDWKTLHTTVRIIL